MRYRVQARGPDGERRLSLCALTRSGRLSYLPPPHEFGDRFGLDEPVEVQGDLLVWAYPYDPILRGLPHAAHGPTVRAASGLPVPTAFSVTPVRYRPRKRAVLRYLVLGRGGVRRVLFGKVLRHDALERTFRAYRNLSRSGIPMSRPERFEGPAELAVFATLPGRSLRDLLIDGARLPSPTRLAGVLDRLGRVRWRDEARPRRPDRSVLAAGRLLGHVLPDRRRDVEAAATSLAERAAAVSAGPTVHGDLYEGQVFVGEGNAIGLIDLEDVGPGDPLLDAANLLAHLAALSASNRRAGRRPLAYRELLRPQLLDVLGATEADLTWREALCMLLLATGPFRVLSPDWPRRVEARVDAAIRLLDRSVLAA